MQQLMRSSKQFHTCNGCCISTFPSLSTYGSSLLSSFSGAHSLFTIFSDPWYWSSPPIYGDRDMQAVQPLPAPLFSTYCCQLHVMWRRVSHVHFFLLLQCIKSNPMLASRPMSQAIVISKCLPLFLYPRKLAGLSSSSITKYYENE